MSHVATYSGGRSVSASWSAGQVLVAVVSARTSGTGVPQLSGWELVGEGRVPAGSERVQVEGAFRLTYYWDVCAIFARRFESAGSGVVSVTLGGGEWWDTTLTVLRYTSGHHRVTSLRRAQNERPIWPASPEVAAGDVVHVGLLDSPSVPTSDTSRALSGRLVVSDAVTAGAVHQVTSTGARTDGLAWTVHLSATPLVPTPVLVEPSASSVDAGVPVTVAWQPIPGQMAYAIERRTGSTTTFWNGSSWVSSRVDVAGSTSSVTVPLTAGSWTLRVSVVVGSTQSAWSQSASVLAATAPGQPTVSVSSWTVRRPTITVSGNAGAGATRTGYLIEVVADGRVVESTLSVSGAWQPQRMPDGPVTVRAAIVQNGDQQGPWREVAGTVVVPPVPAPSVVASIGYLAETAPPDGTGLPGMRLTITTSLPGVVPYEVERDGSGFLAGTLSGSHDVEDYTVGTTYRVRVGDSTSEPIEWSGWVTVTVPEGLDQTHWLIAEQYPELSVKVDHHVYGAAARNLRAQAGVYLDDDSEHITYGVPVRARRPVQIGVRSRWAWERVEALLSSGLLLRMGWCPSTDGTPTPTDVFRVAEYDPSRFIPTRNIDMWRIDFDIIPQDS